MDLDVWECFGRKKKLHLIFEEIQDSLYFTGNNCMYESGHGKFLVPEFGCKIADEAICFCDRLETFCLPPLPMDMTPMCEKNKLR